MTKETQLHPTFREYQTGDYDAIMKLWEEIGLGAPNRGDTAEVIERTIVTGGRLLLMEDAETGEVIGTSWLTVDGRRTYMHHFGISEAWQRKGLAKPLLNYSIQTAKSIGLQLKLEVHKDNQRAVSLYKENGFRYLGDYNVYIIRDIQPGD